MKGKRVEKKDAKTKITKRCVIEEETEIFAVKPLRLPQSGNRSTRQSVGIHGLVRDPPSLIYPMYLSPPSSYSNKISRNRVLSNSPNPATSSILHSPSLASSNTSQQHQKHSQHFECVWVVFRQKSPLNRYNNGKGNEKRLQRFLSKNGQLSLISGCIVETSLRVFLSEQLHQHMWVIGVYIVWVQKVCIRQDNLAKQNVLQVSRGKALPASFS